MSRHPSTINWLTHKLPRVDRVESTLSIESLNGKDCVYGNLTAHLIAQINNKGARYFHVLINIPLELRGEELNSDELSALKPEIAEINAQILSQSVL